MYRMYRLVLSRCLIAIVLVLVVGLISPVAAAGTHPAPGAAAAPAVAPAASAGARARVAAPHDGWLAVLHGWLRALLGGPSAGSGAAAGALHPGAGLDAGGGTDPDGNH
jgi:hypothetical protein